MERAVSHRNGLPHDSEESFKRVASTSRRRVLDTSHQCVDSESSSGSNNSSRTDPKRSSSRLSIFVSNSS